MVNIDSHNAEFQLPRSETSQFGSKKSDFSVNGPIEIFCNTPTL
jgi:hypothetical protein